MDIVRQNLVLKLEQRLVNPSPGGQPLVRSTWGGSLFVPLPFSGEGGNMGSDGQFGDAAFRHLVPCICV